MEWERPIPDTIIFKLSPALLSLGISRCQVSPFERLVFPNTFFKVFFLSVILFFCWADIDEEKSTTASISVNGTYPSLFVPRPQTLALHCLLYLVYHHWFHSKFVHYFFDNKIFCNTTLPFYILLRRLFFLFVLIKTSSAASSGRFYFFSPTCISWPNIASCNEHVIPPR